MDTDTSEAILQIRIQRLQDELTGSDYKALKFLEGLLTEEEYAPIRAERQRLRDAINELREQMNTGGNRE